MTIRMAVGRLKGVNKVSGEAKSRTVTVEYDASTVTVEAIQEALKRVGYDGTTLA